jgi:hypothetical protein
MSDMIIDQFNNRIKRQHHRPLPLGSTWTGYWLLSRRQKRYRPKSQTGIRLREALSIENTGASGGPVHSRASRSVPDLL